MVDLFDKYFTLSEFDSPDQPGSGSNMDPAFLDKLAVARDIAQVPFRITSGYRTKAYLKDLTRRGYATVSNSPHLKGHAADIAVSTSAERHAILTALIQVGFNRIGIGQSYIHVDDDPTKVSNLIWTYNY